MRRYARSLAPWNGPGGGVQDPSPTGRYRPEPAAAPMTDTQALLVDTEKTLASFTPFDILGVPPHADAKTIRKAFLKRAKEFHPDHNPSPVAADAFRAVQAAYAKLTETGGEEYRETEAAIRAVEAAAEAALKARPVSAVASPSARRRGITMPAPTRMGLGPKQLTTVAVAALVVSLAGFGVGIALSLGTALVALPSTLAMLIGIAALAAARTSKPARLWVRGDGLEDTRWGKGFVAYTEIEALRTYPRALEVQLAGFAADRLRASGGPRGALDGTWLKLPLPGDPTRLAAHVRHEARIESGPRPSSF